MALVILNAGDVAALLPMADCIEVMAQAMAALSDGSASIPPRSTVTLPADAGYFALMAGTANEPAMVGCKLATLLPANPAAGRPAIQGMVCLFDARTGAPSAVVDGASLTALRTAAASGLATRLLAREDAATHGIFGTGALLSAHIDAMFAARPSIERVVIWGRDGAKAQAAASREAARTGRSVCASADPAQVAASDVVTTITAATSPVLKGAWLRSGAHINLVGPHRADQREADTQVITRSRVYVDWLEGALREAGDLLIPMSEGAFNKENIVGEIGQVVRGGVAGRTSPEQITLYKSLGVAVQDLFAAHALVQRAVKLSRGVCVEF